MPLRALPTLAVSVALAAPAAAQTAEEVVARMVEARGGLEKLRAVRSVRMSGRLRSGPLELPIVIEIKRPSSVRSEVTFQGSTAVQAYDGTSAWGIPPQGGRPERLPAEMAREMAERADFEGPLVEAGRKGHRLELAGKEKSWGRAEVYRITLVRKTGEREDYVLDAASFLPVRVESMRSVRGNRIEIERTLGDYREAGGVLWPHSIRDAVRGRPETQTLAISRIEVNPPIEDARFDMAAGRAAPPSRPR